MSTASRDELRKTDFLKLADSNTGQITKVISPNPLQVGLDDDEFKSTLIVKGALLAEQGITGSLQYVSDGVDFIQAGSNISVTKNSNGSLTIGATGFTNNPLTVAADGGTMFSSGDTTYDGSTAQRLEIDIYQATGLSIHSTAGLRIDFTSASNATPTTLDRVLIGDQTSSWLTKYCTINDILSLGSPVKVTNALSFGVGIYDSAAGAGSWDNSSPATVSVDLASNGGISAVGGTGALFVNPNLATATTTIDTTNDYVLIYDHSATATRKVALQYIAGVAPNGLTLGSGLTPNGTTYDGSVSTSVAVLAADTTIDSATAGIKVLSVPNSLADGVGIQTLSYDGSGTASVAVDRSTTGGLNFDGSDKLQLDVNNLPAAASPALTDEIPVSFGSNDTRKVDVADLGAVITSTIIQSTVWVDGNLKAKTTSSISIDSDNRYADGTGMADAFFFVSGSIGSRGTTTRGTSIFGGDVYSSGSIHSNVGVIAPAFSGSLTRLTDGTSYLIAGSNVTITSGTNGSVTIASSGGGGGGSVTFQSGSTSVASVSTIDTTKLGVIQDLGAGSIALTGSIGTAEDGSYTDGLFTDFTSNTPVGTAVDRFNEVLKGLAPSAAPDMNDMDSDNTGANAKLSFGTSQTIGSYTNVQPSTLSSPASSLSDVDINGTFSATNVSNDIRSAVFDGSTAITGTLNADVSADGSNYPNFAFGSGDVGTLNLFINDNTSATHQVDLSVFSSGDSKAATDGSGFVNVSAADPGAFSDGSSFSTFKHRTGSFVIGVSNQRPGWNYARVTHVVGTATSSANYVTWVNDNDSNALSSAGSAMDSLSMTGLKKLSGARYNTGGTAEYRIRVTNAYRNVYPTTNITFSTSNCSISSQAFPAIDYASGENETKTLQITGSATINADPILNDSISANTSVPAVLKSSLSGVGSQSISGILLYDLSNTSSTTSETFRAENYRLMSGSYNAQADVTDNANAWDSALHMSGTNSGHEDGLLFYNSRLYAPVQGAVSGDFRNTADGGSITNGPSNNVNYSGITSGTRTFYRYFQNTSGGSKSNFSLTINGSGTIANQSTTLNTSNLHALLKIPTTDSAFSTGWMDLAVAFATGQTGDGDGCLDGSFDSSLNATNGGTFGTESVGDNEYIMVKIEADASWTGYISSMSISWS